jgi:hypothetical protein
MVAAWTLHWLSRQGRASLNVHLNGFKTDAYRHAVFVIILCMQANSALKCHKRYMHYFTHFQNHQDSHKKEKEQQ